jgi:Domain of unknown function (DUF4573)
MFSSGFAVIVVNYFRLYHMLWSTRQFATMTATESSYGPAATMAASESTERPAATLTATESTDGHVAGRKVALLDCNSTADEDESQTAASFTNSDHNDEPKERTASFPQRSSGSSRVDDEAVSENSMCEEGNDPAPVAQLEASHCASRNQLFECITEWFAPQPEKQKSDMAQNSVQRTLSGIQKSLGACHDKVDAVLISVFDQPVEEVQMRDSMDQSDTQSFNEDLTVDSTLESGQDDEAPRRVEDRPAAGVLGDNESQGMDLERIPTTDSEAASLLRFKEELYKSLDAKLDEVLADTYEEQLPSPPSVDLGPDVRDIPLSNETEADNAGTPADNHLDMTDTEKEIIVVEDSLNDNDNDFKPSDVQTIPHDIPVTKREVHVATPLRSQEFSNKEAVKVSVLGGDSHTSGPAEVPFTAPTRAFQGTAPTRAFQDTAPTRAFQDTAPTRAFQDTAPTRAIQDTAPTRAIQDTAPTRAFQDTAPTRSIQDTAPTRAIQDTAPTRAIQDTAPTRAFQDTAPTRSIQDTAPTRAIQESRTEEQDSDVRLELSSPSMDEYDRLLRTDIEKLDRVGERRRNFKKSLARRYRPNADSQPLLVEKPDSPEEQQLNEYTDTAAAEQGHLSTKCPTTKRTVSPTFFVEENVDTMMPVKPGFNSPLRADGQADKEPEIVDLVHYKPGSQWPYEPSVPGAKFRYEFPDQELVIDLTMYDEGF